jgi:hypothetical protein
VYAPVGIVWNGFFAQKIMLSTCRFSHSVRWLWQRIELYSSWRANANAVCAMTYAKKL